MFIKVKVKTDLKKEYFEKTKEDTFIIGVKEKAERNLANNRICEIVASIFEIKVSCVRIVKGHHSENKILSVKL
jgi:uncharacterized protein YggU (UPF0235/DUF167 family)